MKKANSDLKCLRFFICLCARLVSFLIRHVVFFSYSLPCISTTWKAFCGGLTISTTYSKFLVSSLPSHRFHKHWSSSYPFHFSPLSPHKDSRASHCVKNDASGSTSILTFTRTPWAPTTTVSALSEKGTYSSTATATTRKGGNCIGVMFHTYSHQFNLFHQFSLIFS